MNKINTLDHINDLAIQFYEMKREKRRQKQTAKNNIKEKKSDTPEDKTPLN